MNKKEKVTMQDIAEAAGVSIATVSRAINDKNSVKENTYNKIIRVMRETGYELYTNQHNTNLILILLPDIENPFYSKVIAGISQAASRQGYQEIIVRTGNCTLDYDFIVNIVNKTQAEGVITLDPIPSAVDIERISQKIPLVQCAEYNEESSASFVSIDDAAISRSVVETMISKGKKRIALINGPLKYKYARKRQEGYLQALANAEITPIENLMVALPKFSYDAAISVATQMLTLSEPPDCIFAASDIFAVAALKAARRLKLKVPEDVSIIGFDNTNISIMSEPPLTTVWQPQIQLGFLAGEMLIEHIRDNTTPPRQIFLDAEIIIRESI